MSITIVHTSCALCGQDTSSKKAYTWKGRVVCGDCAQKLEGAEEIKETPQTNEYNSLPIDKVLCKAAPLVLGGADVYFKFSCAHCSLRQSFEEPNMYYLFGTCERCGRISRITRAGFLMSTVAK